MSDANGRRTSTVTTAAGTVTELQKTTVGGLKNSPAGAGAQHGDDLTAYEEAGNDLVQAYARRGLFKATEVLPGESVAAALLRLGVIGS